jgi:hypothetical protein
MDEIGIEHRGYGVDTVGESAYVEVNHDYLIYSSFGLSKSQDFIYKGNNFGVRDGKTASLTLLKKITRHVHLGGTVSFNVNNKVTLSTPYKVLEEKDSTLGISAAGELCYPIRMFEPFIVAAPTVNINNAEIKSDIGTERFGGTAVGAKFTIGIRAYISDLYLVGLLFEKSYNIQTLRRHGTPVATDFNFTVISLSLGAYY